MRYDERLKRQTTQQKNPQSQETEQAPELDSEMTRILNNYN